MLNFSLQKYSLDFFFFFFLSTASCIRFWKHYFGYFNHNESIFLVIYNNLYQLQSDQGFKSLIVIAALCRSLWRVGGDPFPRITPGPHSLLRRNISAVASRWQHSAICWPARNLNLRPPSETNTLPLEQLPRMFLEREVWGSYRRPVKLDTLLPTTRQRCDISSKETVLPGRNDADVVPPTRYKLRRFTASIIKDLIWFWQLIRRINWTEEYNCSTSLLDIVQAFIFKVLTTTNFLGCWHFIIFTTSTTIWQSKYSNAMECDFIIVGHWSKRREH